MSKITELLLHIGHPKTGSSYIQASLANAIPGLAEHGIEYYGGQNGPATEWRISSGNGQLLISEPMPQFKFSHPKVLFSSEAIFHALAQPKGFAERLSEFCTCYNVQHVRVLLFIRDPILHAESAYQQMLKRRMGDQDLEQVFKAFRVPGIAVSALKVLDNLPSSEVDILNYGNHKHTLLDDVAKFLGVPSDVLPDGDKSKVNRSMTTAELALLSAIRANNRDLSSAVSIALCEQLPDVTPERKYPSRDVQREMIARLMPAIEIINARIPTVEHYDVSLQEPTPVSDTFTFSQAQLKTIASALTEANATGARQKPMQGTHTNERKALETLPTRGLLTILKAILKR